MKIFKKSSDIHEYLCSINIKGKIIGFIPTMGALHLGHISLIEQAKRNNHFTVCSIFVNPTQFNNSTDFEKYPSTLEQDINQLEKAGCRILFLPSVKEIYPEGIEKKYEYELGYLETVLEGKYRPGHFQGVCQVVDRLLQIIPANYLYLGQKDYQQCMVIKKLIELKRYNTSLIICPTLREKDGLAMSSRNMRLSSEERKIAGKIYESLIHLKNPMLHLKDIDWVSKLR